MQLIAKTFAGLEEVLAQEIKDLGGENIQVLKRAVSFQGNQELLYKANLHLRTALRILLPIHEFKARNEEALYRQIHQINWTEYMGASDTLAVDAVVNSTFFRHSKYAALKTKDAIVDRFRREKGVRPDVNVFDPTLRIHLHIQEADCSIALDSSGDSLHKRGYRAEKLEAPINEVLAAGLVLLSGWQADSDFIDPMCGSGTILIEAALFAYGLAPQLKRVQFGFKRWNDFDKDLWKKVMEEAQQAERHFEHQLYGYDISFKAKNLAFNNAIKAGLEDKVTVERQNFEQLQAPGTTGLLIMNPPYDERLPVEQIAAFYRIIGDRLKQAFAGYEAWIISSNMEALKQIGLRPASKKVLYNGPLECKFQQYQLFSGSLVEKIKEDE